jgi:hypothetical protein
MDLLLRAVLVAWGLSLLLVLVLIIGPRIAARIQYDCNLWRRARYRAAIRAVLAQEARDKELLDLLAPAPEDTCHDLVGCILCRFDLEGHKS